MKLLAPMKELSSYAIHMPMSAFANLNESESLRDTFAQK
jgi:hypothetical protein